jgi:hypothetical protein
LTKGRRFNMKNGYVAFSVVLPSELDRDRAVDLEAVLEKAMDEEWERVPEESTEKYLVLQGRNGNSCSVSRLGWFTYTKRKAPKEVGLLIDHAKFSLFVKKLVTDAQSNAEHLLPRVPRPDDFTIVLDPSKLPEGPDLNKVKNWIEKPFMDYAKSHFRGEEFRDWVEIDKGGVITAIARSARQRVGV